MEKEKEKKLRVPWNKGKKGLQVNVRKGKKCPEISARQMGENNPMFGRTGEKSHRWKGGISKIGNCPDCGEKLGCYLSEHCHNCFSKYRVNNTISGEKHWKWKGGIPKCLDCGKDIAYKAKYCSSCSKIAERNGNWKGGLSFENYPVEFNNILKRKIKNRDDNQCVICGWGLDENSKQRLVIHHIDYDKSNLDPYNLVTLCSSCHNKTNRDRGDWIKFFEELMKCYQ